MTIRPAWLLGTVAAYALPGGSLAFGYMWEQGDGLGWTNTATHRLAWAATVFLVSTVVLSRRNPSASTRWIVIHAVLAFVLGAAGTWGVLENQMTGSQHPWDTEVPGGVYCLDCAPRLPMIRQTLVATLLGALAAAGLAPLVARVARHGWRRRIAAPG